MPSDNEIAKVIAEKFRTKWSRQWMLIAVGAWQQCGRGKCSRGFDLVFENRGTGELRKEKHECGREHTELWRTLKGLHWQIGGMLPPRMQEESKDGE